MQVQGNDCYVWEGGRWIGLGGAIEEYLTLGRSRVSSAVGTEPVETRFMEGSHFVKGRFG